MILPVDRLVCISSRKSGDPLPVRLLGTFLVKQVISLRGRPFVQDTQLATWVRSREFPLHLRHRYGADAEIHVVYNYRRV